MNRHAEIMIIGAGFYGLFLAKYFAECGKKVVVVEKENAALTRASYHNQARVHNGYHYPRSVLTGLRSRALLPKFLDEFESCVDKSFEKIYLIGKPLGNITSSHFEAFCRRIGAPYTASDEFRSAYCNQNLIEKAYSVEEFAFNALSLKDKLIEQCLSYGVEILFDFPVERVSCKGRYLSVYSQNNMVELFSYQIFNCTYSCLNCFHERGISQLIPLKHELTEICLVEVPPELQQFGVTVMCGPFFSFMPFPASQFHSFTHVRYTPHDSWSEVNECVRFNEKFTDLKRSFTTSWALMKRDASRYIPKIAEMELKRSLFEIKTVLPSSETSDSRPILFRQDHGLKGFHSVMGGKIDNVYDIIQLIKKRGLDK